MTEHNIKQFWHEFESWKRLLEYIQSENVYLKNRLSVIIKEEFTENLLDDIEYFLANLIAQENVFMLLRNDISSQETWLKREIFEETPSLKEILKSQKRLRKEIETTEHKFNKLKFEFNSFFSEKLIK